MPRMVRIGEAMSQKQDSAIPTAAIASVGRMPTVLPSSPPTTAPTGLIP